MAVMSGVSIQRNVWQSDTDNRADADPETSQKLFIAINIFT